MSAPRGQVSSSRSVASLSVLGHHLTSALRAPATPFPSPRSRPRVENPRGRDDVALLCLPGARCPARSSARCRHYGGARQRAGRTATSARRRAGAGGQGGARTPGPVGMPGLCVAGVPSVCREGGSPLSTRRPGTDQGFCSLLQRPRAGASIRR